MQNPARLLQFATGPRLPVLLQSEVAECGPACLAMIASHHGHKMDIESIRRHLPTSLKGSTLKDLMVAAGQFFLTARALRLEIDHLTQLRLPAILHWKLDHFVVLAAVRRGGVVIHDPARGRRTLAWSEFSAAFTGVALELVPAAGFQARDETRRVHLRELLGRTTGLRGALAQLLALSAALQVFALLAPFYIQITVDHALLAGDLPLLHALALGFGFLALVQMATGALRAWAVLYLNSTLDIQLVSNVLRHLLHLPADFFERRHTGDVLSRFGSLRSLRELFTNGLVESVIDGLMAAGTLVVMLAYSPALAGVAAAAVALYAASRLLLYRLNREYVQEALVLSAKEQSTFLESVRAIVPIKLFAREHDRESRWQNDYAAALNARIRSARLGIFYDAFNRTVFPLAAVLIVWLGARDILAGTFSVGMLYAFFAYQSQFSQRAGALVDKLLAFHLASVDMARLSDIVHAAPEPGVSVPVAHPRPLSGNIEVRRVAFRYSPTDPYIFKGLSFGVKKGESVAIVGPSGCGKTTLLKLLLGLLGPQSGEVRFDGRNAAELGKKALRGQIAAVMQDDQLLSGSIAENISFFDPAPDLKWLHQCAQMAAVAEDILRMPMGYSSRVGDMGAALSGGQKQRILLARALYRRPRILFLDEASSHLDLATEQRINDTLRRLHITRIMIAHRPHTIALADRIVDLSATGASVRVSPSLANGDALPRLA